MSAFTKSQWGVRLNWMDVRIIENQLPEHATLVAENLHEAWLRDDLERVELLWNTFVAGNPGFVRA